MNISNVIDVLNMDDGQVVECVKGKLTELYKQSTGTKNNRPWSVQNGTLKDAKGNETIRVTFWNRDDLRSYKGKLIYILSVPDKSGQPTGMKYEVKEYNGEDQPQINVQDKAEISLSLKEGIDKDPDLQHQDLDEKKTPPAKKGTTPPAKPPAQSGPVTVNDLDPSARKLAIQLANLRVLAERAADYAYDTYRAVYDGEFEPRALEPQQVSAIATGIFIELKDGGMVEKMPAKRLEVPQPPEDTPPEEPPPDDQQDAPSV